MAPDGTDDLELTPLRAHYLKRELVALQLGHELEVLGEVPDALSLLGPPFTPPKSAAQASELIFLRFFFHDFVREFPFLRSAPPTFFSQKLQPFVASFLAKNITASEDRDEETKRRRLAGKLEKHFGLLLSSAIKLADNNGQEEVIRITAEGAVTAPVGDGLLPDAAKAEQDGAAVAPVPAPVRDFEVNVVTIRIVTIKGRLRSKSHEEFVILVKRKNKPDVYVCRRYGEFARLAVKLRTEYPEQDIRPPPAKDRRTTEARSSSTPPTPSTPQSPPRTPFEPHRSPISHELSSSPPDSFELSGARSPIMSPAVPFNGKPATLARERNRLTLRAYLRHLLHTQNVGNSKTLRDFLLDDPIQLTQAEMVGVRMREEMDRVREEEMANFRSEVESRVKELESHLRWFREELVKRDGLRRVFGMIKTTPKVENLPIEYRKVIEWARISLASTIYQLFLGSDNSSAVFHQLKRMHGLMPYFVLRGILRISNPVAMIRGVLDLFLARPFGQHSLLQRMFSSGLTDEVRELKEDMELVANKIAHPAMLEKVKAYVKAPRETQKSNKDDAKAQKVDLMTIIQRSTQPQPLDRAALQRLPACDKAYQEYLRVRDDLDDPEDDEGPTNDDAWLYEDLHVYMRLAARVRDKEQMIELIFEGGTSELLKDMVTIFYQPLAQVYKAANIAESIVDLQSFLNDLIKTVEHAENSQVIDPQKTVQTFVDLVARHEGAFYTFVHNVHTKGSELFDDLMQWIESFVNFVRDGLPEAIPLDYLLPAAPSERRVVLAEVDAIVDYHRKLKEAHHERMRRRMVRGEAKEIDHDAAFVDGVMKNLDLGTIAGDVDELNAVESDEDADPDDSSDEIHFHDADPTESHHERHERHERYEHHEHHDHNILHIHRHRHSADSAPPSPKIAPHINKRKRKKDRVVLEAPHVEHLTRISAVFVELLRPSLERAMGDGHVSRPP